jgi:putative tryptophan/tyrosine transport system substrate-binding protein
MRRREFIAALVGAAYPFSVGAQPSGKVPLVVYVAQGPEGDPEERARAAAFRTGFEKLGWAAGGNVSIDYRWGKIEWGKERAVASEIVSAGPSVILVSGSVMAEALRNATKSIPIVFVNVTDPLATGLVNSMARPEGNLTGFADYQFSMGGYWMAILKEAASRIKRVLVISAPGDFGQEGLLRAARVVAEGIKAQMVSAAVLTAPELDKEITAFAREPNGGIVALPGDPSRTHRDVIITLAARRRLPAVYGDRLAIARGGMMSYDADIVDLHRRAAFYVDRILKGAKPGDLPVQLPTRYDLAVNLKAAKALGVTIPLWFLATADEVVE